MAAKDRIEQQNIDGALTNGTVIHAFASSYDLRDAAFKQVTFDATSNELSLLIKTGTAILTLAYHDAFVQNFPLLNEALRHDGPRLLYHDFDVICGRLQHAFVFDNDEFYIAFSAFDFVALPRSAT